MANKLIVRDRDTTEYNGFVHLEAKEVTGMAMHRRSKNLLLYHGKVDLQDILLSLKIDEHIQVVNNNRA